MNIGWLNHVLKRLALTWLALLALAAHGGEQRPNLVFILADDLRWNTLGCMGDTIVQTPNVDRLAAQGTLFRNCFATTSICCVSRASILTGQYERRHGIPNFSKGLSPQQWSQTYPALLRQAGYRTGFIGKFGVGGKNAIAAKASEFDFWRGVPGQGGRYFIDPNDPTHTHTTAKFGNQALEFLDGCTTNQPFCLSLSFNAPHARDGEAREFQPDLRDENLYATNIIPHSPTANREYFEKLQPFVQKSEGHNRWTNRFATEEMFQRTMRDYYRLVTGIDREVGRIQDELQRRNLAGNTVIIFMSDNGWFAGDRELADKWLMYEESIRLPLIIYDPRQPAARRGNSVDAMALNLDSAQTILDYAGVPAPAGMQGRSLVPLVTGLTPPDWRTEFFYEHHYAPEIIPPSEGVRTEKWCFIHWLPPNPEVEELYDLSGDSLEGKNVAADPKFAGTLEELRTRWKTYQRELK
jgi:arylsulfatase A-like enzyme